MQISNSTRQRSYFGVQSDRPGRSRVPDCYMNFAKIIFFIFFWKNVNFKIHKTAELLGAKTGPSRKEQRFQILLWISIFVLFFWFSNKNMQFSKLTRTRRRGDPNRARPREAENPDTLVNFDGFVDAFGRPIADTCPDASVASEPYTPRPKDCTGLGPNTLK